MQSYVDRFFVRSKKTVNEAKLKFGYFDYIQGVPTSFGWKLFRRAYLKFARFQFVKKIVKLKGDPHSTMPSQKTNKFTILFVFCNFSISEICIFEFSRLKCRSK